MATSGQRWNFPSNDGGEIRGIADGGVETFKGTPVKSLAREICQNSLDARLNSEKPVRIEFKKFEIFPKDILGHESLEDAIKLALDFWQQQNYKKEADFFSCALKAMRKRGISCLRISDFNTTGLTGSHEEYNSPWCNLTKSSGASDKSGGAGGSFGIGKFAPYACSVLRTVFYSTSDTEGICAAQGVARLASFKDKDGKITQGTGFYGNEKNAPMHNQLSLDPAYSRPAGETGTDIFILGFSAKDSWRQEMIMSILDSFLYAVYSGNLVADVDGERVSKDTLAALMDAHRGAFKEHADQYYEVLVDNESAKTFEKTLDDDPETEGRLALKLMVKPNFCRRVAMVRQTGMKIQDKGNISKLIPFAGVLFIEGDALNSYLRGLENPQHLKWETERAENESKAKKLLGKINGFIRDSLDEMKGDESEDAIDPDVGEYLPACDAEESPTQSSRESIQDYIKDIRVKKIDAVKKPASASVISESEKTLVDDEDGEIAANDLPGYGSGGNAKRGGNDGNGGGDAPGDGGGNEPAERNKKPSFIPLLSVRSIVRDKSGGEYTIVLTPKISAKDGVLEVFMSAESQHYKAPIISASCAECPELELFGNRISNLEFKESRALRVNVRLDYHDYCSLEVEAYGN